MWHNSKINLSMALKERTKRKDKRARGGIRAAEAGVRSAQSVLMQVIAQLDPESVKVVAVNGKRH